MSCYEITLRTEFSAAHRLKLLNGAFEPLHGHNWRVEVVLRGAELDSIGLLADFTDLQPQLATVTGELHDKCLNELPCFADRNPSTEHVARHIHDRLAANLPSGVRVHCVRVWETSACAAAYYPRGAD